MNRPRPTTNISFFPELPTRTLIIKAQFKLLYAAIVMARICVLSDAVSKYNYVHHLEITVSLILLGIIDIYEIVFMALLEINTRLL